MKHREGGTEGGREGGRDGREQGQIEIALPIVWNSEEGEQAIRRRFSAGLERLVIRWCPAIISLEAGIQRLDILLRHCGWRLAAS